MECGAKGMVHRVGNISGDDFIIKCRGKKGAKFRFQDLKIWQLAIEIADELR